jgi:hypothetical protein
MSLLDLSDDVAKDSTCGNFDKGGEQPNEEHLDVPVDGLDANVLDASLIEHEEDEVEEQLMLLKLASDMWSQVSADVAFRAAADDETTSLPTSRGSQSPSFSLPSLDDISVDPRATSLFRKAFNAILLESGEASTKSEFCSDDVDGHSVDEISRAKAFLVKVLSPIGEKIRNDDRERAAGYPAAAKVVGKKLGEAACLGRSPSCVSTACPTPRLSSCIGSNADPLSPPSSSRISVAQPGMASALAHKRIVPAVTALPTTSVILPSPRVTCLAAVGKGETVITTTTTTMTTTVSTAVVRPRHHGRRVMLA